MWWRKRLAIPVEQRPSIISPLTREEALDAIKTTIRAVVQNVYAEQVHFRVEGMVTQEVRRVLGEEESWKARIVISPSAFKGPREEFSRALEFEFSAIRKEALVEYDKRNANAPTPNEELNSLISAFLLDMRNRGYATTVIALSLTDDNTKMGSTITDEVLLKRVITNFLTNFNDPAHVRSMRYITLDTGAAV